MDKNTEEKLGVHVEEAVGWGNISTSIAMQHITSNSGA